MNEILADCRAQFDIMQEFSLCLTVNDSGEPLLNERKLPWFSNLVLSSAYSDAESICFLFNGDRFLKVMIQWPEEEALVISAVFIGYGNADETAV